MTPNEIRKWRPRRFADFAGMKNAATIQRLVHAIQNKCFPSPLLLVSIYGYGKTSLVRLLMEALCCDNPDRITADPCRNCYDCRFHGQLYNGHGHNLRHWEFDGTHWSRNELIGLIGEHRYESGEVLFFDELHHLHERHSQEPLLKFVEDYDGYFIGAVMEDRLNEIIPPLRERMDIVHLFPPTEGEMVEFLLGKACEWGINAKSEAVQLMVTATQCSFRRCFKVMGAAALSASLEISDVERILGIDGNVGPAIRGDEGAVTHDGQDPPSFATLSAGES